MYKEIAIIAPTASGKTALSIELAHKTNSIILSLDSLSVYKEIDIASAKPTLQDRDGIIHFGIDEVYPNEKFRGKQAFDVVEFIDCYSKAKQYAKEHNKNLIIVGGTSFYLKAMVNGISPFPSLSKETNVKVQEALLDLDDSYKLLESFDPIHMQKVEKNDRYRIGKALEIYFETNLMPSEYFKQNKPEPIIKDLQIFQIETDVAKLRQRIALRTEDMLQKGIVDEVKYLEEKYTREPNCMKSIGIKEVLEYFDGKLDKKELKYWITTHTAQLAKRQRTFNKSQFQGQIKGELSELKKKVLELF
jgi:tRNA dimethylallyltransferase